MYLQYSFKKNTGTNHTTYSVITYSITKASKIIDKEGFIENHWMFGQLFAICRTIVSPNFAVQLYQNVFSRTGMW